MIEHRVQVGNPTEREDGVGSNSEEFILFTSSNGKLVLTGFIQPGGCGCCSDPEDGEFEIKVTEDELDQLIGLIDWIGYS